jgi:hypothetical protein
MDIGTVIAYKHLDRPRGPSERRRTIMASKKTAKKLKPGKKLQSTKNLEIVITKHTDVGSPN